MRAIVAETVRRWRSPAVWVGCSGNFTVERTLADADVALHGNDVQLYSCALGAYLSGQPFRLEIRPEYRDRFDWLAESLTTPAERTATVLLASRLLMGVDNSNAYYTRLRASYERHWPTLLAKTTAKVEASPVRLASFTAADVLQYFAAVPPGAGVICFPPFFAGDYEAQFRGLDKVFAWDAPTFDTFDEDSRQRLIDAVVVRDAWLLGLHVRPPALEPHLRGVVQTTNRGVPIYLYVGEGPTRCVRPRQVLSPVLAPRLLPGARLGTRLALAVLSGGQFVTLRSQYMNRHIRPGQPLLACAVLVDGVVVGAFAFSWDHFDAEGVYLLSDFPVAPTSYPRLAKLVLYAAQSIEAQRLIQRALSTRVRRMQTTAFTQKPVSMKYRGLFQLVRRTKSEDPHHTWQLQYASPMGRWTLAEGYAQWTQQHGMTAGH